MRFLKNFLKIELRSKRKSSMKLRRRLVDACSGNFSSLKRKECWPFRKKFFLDRVKMMRYSTGGQQTATPEQYPKGKGLNTNFDDHVVAFKGKTTMEIIRAYLIYQLLSIDPLVNHNVKLMKLFNRILGQKLFVKLMKNTFFGHFAAGENQNDVVPMIERLLRFNVRSIIDYAAEADITSEKAVKLEKKALEDSKTELPQFQVPSDRGLDRRKNVVSARTYFYEDEEHCDKNMEHFLRCVDIAANAAKKTGIAAVKMTALCKPKILLQISEVITKSRMYMGGGSKIPVISQHVSKQSLEDMISEEVAQQPGSKKFLDKVTSDSEGVIHLFPWSGLLNDELEVNETFEVPDVKTGKMVRFMTQLTKEEEVHFKNTVRRLNKVAKAASEADVRLIFDAEQTYFQPAISRITVEMMSKYNKTRPLIYNTYQNYLLSSYEEVVGDLEQAKRQDFIFCCKLVRGAYIEQERERARTMNYPDPIQPTYEATTENYNRTLSECVKHIENYGNEKKVMIIVASHNEDTIRMAVEKIKEIGLAPDDGRISFGQLLGMCDFISYSLADARYEIYKYVPYAPVMEFLPYVSRRLHENRGILKNVKKEKKMLRKEIIRRLKKMDMNRNPML